MAQRAAGPSGDACCAGRAVRIAVAIALAWLVACWPGAATWGAGLASGAVAPALRHDARAEAAMAAVSRLPEVRALSRAVAPRPVAFAPFGVQRERVGGRRGFSVSVYVDSPERLELWRTFFVDARTGRVTDVEDLQGDFVPIGRWRRSSEAAPRH
jgi:hypothetical protein